MNRQPNKIDAEPAAARLLQGPVGPMLLRMAVPMFWGMLAVTSFNVVDTLYVGRLGAKPLAAMGYTFPVVFVVQCVLMGMSVGTSSLVSRAIGEGDYHRVRRLTTDALLLSGLLVIVLSALGAATIGPVLRLMGATPDIVELARPYIMVWLAGVWLLTLPMVGNAAIRATGDALSPSVIMVVSGGINIILDPLLIFGLGPFPRMELRGAAIASVVSWVLACGVSLWILVRKLKLLDLRWPSAQAVWASWRQLAYLGLPAVATNLLMPLSAGMLTRMVSAYGPEAVAAFGVGTRLETLAMSGAFALSTVLAPFVGQNFGAGRIARVREGVHAALRFGFGWGVGMCVLFAVLAGPLARLFNDHDDVIRVTCLYLWIVPLSYGAYAASAQVTSLFNATHHPLRSASVFVLRLFVFTLPLAYAGGRLGGLTGLFAGIAAGNMATGLAAVWMKSRFLRTLENPAR